MKKIDSFVCIFKIDAFVCIFNEYSPIYTMKKSLRHVVATCDTRHATRDSDGRFILLVSCR